MGKPSSKTTPKTTNNKFWKFCNLADSQKAELFLYGDISETSWWGDEVTPKQFADDLAALGDVTEITVYINSGGGDVFAAQAIGNQLARNAAIVTAHIDGLCASAATIVACHADKVVAAADSTYMVHPVSMGLCGYLTADEMRNYLKALDATRESIVSLYAKKTGMMRMSAQSGWMKQTGGRQTKPRKMALWMRWTMPRKTLWWRIATVSCSSTPSAPTCLSMRHPNLSETGQRLNRPPSGLKITTRRNRRNTTTMGR